MTETNIEIQVEPKRIGHWIIMPDILLRFFARWFLGWRWVDYQETTE